MRDFRLGVHAVGHDAAFDHCLSADHDIVAEAFCRLLQSAESPATDEERRRYLFKIAGNLVVDRWRRQQRDRERDEDRLEGRADVAIVPRGAEGGDVAAGFSRLSEHDRVLLWLAYVEEHSHAEIAAAVGVRTSSVKMLLSRARSRLRRLLESAAVR